MVLLVSSLATSSSAMTKVTDEVMELGKAIVTVVADKTGGLRRAGGARRQAAQG
jgi:hypothetical protein